MGPGEHADRDGGRRYVLCRSVDYTTPPTREAGLGRRLVGCGCVCRPRRRVGWRGIDGIEWVLVNGDARADGIVLALLCCAVRPAYGTCGVYTRIRHCADAIASRNLLGFGSACCVRASRLIAVPRFV